MSFGIFEAAVAGDKENEHQKKLAKTRLAQAAAEVDQKLGPFLSKATSKSDYIERVRLAENDFREIVGKYLEGDTGFKAVATKMVDHYVRKEAAAKNLHMLDDMQVLDGYATVSMGLEEGWGVDEGMTQEDLQDYAEELERRGIDPYNNDVYSSRRRARARSFSNQTDQFQSWFNQNYRAEDFDDYDEESKEGFVQEYLETKTARRKKSRAASRRKEATPWEEGSEPQFMETGWGEYVMEYGDYSAAVQEDGSWAVVHNGRVVGEGEGSGDPDDSFGEVEQWFKKKGAGRVKKARRPVRFIHEPGTQGSSFASPIAVFPDSWQDTGRYDSSDGGQYQILGPSWRGEDNPGDVYPGAIVDSWEETEDMDWARKTFPKIFDSDEYEIVTKNSSRKAAVTEEEAAEAFYQALGPDFYLEDLNDPNMPKEMADPVNDIARDVARQLGVTEYDIWDAVSFHPPRTARRKRSAGSGYDVYNHPDVGELHVTFYNDGTAVVASPEVGEVGSIRVMPDDGADEIEEQLNILVDEVRYASKKTAGEYLRPGDLEDHGTQIFFNQYADSHGIDTYGEDYDRMWNDIMESVEYDVISADLDDAVEYGELSSAVGSRLQWDLEDFYGFGTGARFSSKRSHRASRGRLSFDRVAGGYDWGDKDYQGYPWPDYYTDEDKESDWLEFAKEHPGNLYDVGDTLEDKDFLRAPFGTSVTVPTDDFDGEGNPGEFDLVKGPRGGWHNQDFKADLHWSEIGPAPVSDIPQNRRRASRRKVAKERFPGTNEMFERAGWQSTDPEKSEWLSPSGYAMYDGSEGSVFYFDPDDVVSSFYTLEDEEFGDDLPQRLTDDEEYQSRLWEY